MKLNLKYLLLCSGLALLAYLEVEAGRLLRPDPPAAEAPAAGVDPVRHLGRLFTRGVSALTQALQLPDESSCWNSSGSGIGSKESSSEDAGNEAVERFWKELRAISWCPVRSSILGVLISGLDF